MLHPRRFLAPACVVFSFLAIPAAAQKAPAQVTNSIGMEFVLIPAGSFMMGTKGPNCPKDDPFTERNEYANCMSGVSGDETPQHRVTISRPFYLGKTEVTQAQWYAVMGNNPANFKTEKAGMDSRNHPVEEVSWDDVQIFINRLNAKEGKNVYRLPTEAEWEYAARAGTTGERYGALNSIAWYDGNSGNKTHPVAQKAPNAWGLYDMLGNVWEWVQDWYGDDYYANSPSTDPRGPSAGSDRVYRGGSCYDDARFVRAAYRSYGDPGLRFILGFRLARSLP
jgi:formylglycine-generating enzyme required for sulfatase activity